MSRLVVGSILLLAMVCYAAAVCGVIQAQDGVISPMDTSKCACDSSAGTCSCTLTHGASSAFYLSLFNGNWVDGVSVTYQSPDAGTQTLGTIPARATQSYQNTMYVAAPPSGVGSTVKSGYVQEAVTNQPTQCWQRTYQITVNYGYSSAEYVNHFNNDANPAISAADAAISAAQNKIAEASNYGLSDTFSATLAQATTANNQAKSGRDQSNQKASSGDYNGAYSSLDGAISLAGQAKTTADGVTTAVTQALSAPLSYSVSPSKPAVNLYSGKSETITFTVNSQDSRKMSCTYQTPSGTSSLGVLQTSSAQSFSAAITAPASGSGTQTFSVTVGCNVGNYAQGTKSASVQVQYQPDPATTAIQQATDSINGAGTQIQSLETSIQSALSQNPAVDLFLGDARQDLDKAKQARTQAQSALASATQTFSSGDSAGAVIQANSAKSQADSINAIVQNGVASVTKALEDVKTEGGQAANQIKSAQAQISSAQSWIDRANTIINNATNLGMDTKDYSAEVETAKGSVSNANTYLSQANTALSASNFAQAKTNSQSAQSNAVDAETKAKDAYERLNSVMEACRTGYQEMQKAQSEISNAEKTYARLAQVVKGLPEQVNTTQLKQDVETQRQKIDQAKNDYSAAQNKVSAGYCTQAVDQATVARNAAADANNMLNRVTENMSDTIKAGLDKSVQELKNNLQDAQATVNSAAGTYGVAGDRVAAAQENVTALQIQLKSAEASVADAKATTTLSDFLDKASAAFGKIIDLQAKVNDSKNEATAAKNDALAKTVGGAAVVVGTGGVGFMWWRRRKGIVKQPAAEPTGEKHVVAEKTEKKPKAPVEHKGKENKAHAKHKTE